MAMADVIREILTGIPSGHVFDSHFIIDEILRRGSDEYIRFGSHYAESETPTLTSHQQIGQQIASFEGILVERQPSQAYSYNIHNTASECALWRRL